MTLTVSRYGKWALKEVFIFFRIINAFRAKKHDRNTTYQKQSENRYNGYNRIYDSSDYGNTIKVGKKNGVKTRKQ